MRYLRSAPILLLLASCAPEPEETPYGSAADVRAYLQEIEPYIRQVSAVQQQVHGQVGTSGAGTGQNLSEVMDETRPLLQQLHDDFSGVTPPPLLGPLHRDIGRLISLRLAAFDATTKGWQLERQKGDAALLYAEAEEKLQEANGLSAALNDQLKDVNTALQEFTSSQQAASR